jgi:hypothetical protein
VGPEAFANTESSSLEPPKIQHTGERRNRAESSARKPEANPIALAGALKFRCRYHALIRLGGFYSPVAVPRDAHSKSSFPPVGKTFI